MSNSNEHRAPSGGNRPHRPSGSSSEHTLEFLKVLRNINHLIITATDPVQLIRHVNQTLTEHLDYYSSWIALLDSGNRPVALEASGFNGDDARLRKQIEKGVFPECMVHCMTTSDSLIVEHPETTCSQCPLSAEYHGRAGLSCRLSHGGRIYGVMTVSVPRSYAYNEEEQLYFRELAHDIAFALGKIEESHQLRLANDIIDHSHAVAFLWEKQGSWPVTYASRNTLGLLGHASGDFISGRISFRDMIHPDDLQAVLREAEEHLENPETVSFEHTDYRIVKTDGNVVWIKDITTLFRNEETGTLGCESILFDITEHKHAEEKLKATSFQLRHIFENANVGIMMIKGGRFFFKGNQRLADILGYESPSEMQGISMRKLHLSEERYLEFGAHHYEKLKDGEQFQVEYQLRRKNGEPVWCSLSGKALDPENLDNGVIWIIDDLEERKKAELKLLEDNKRLEEATVRSEMANKAKSDFLANMNHEIRTPLNGVIGMTGILLESGLTTEQQRYAQIINSSSNTLLNLVNDILDFCKIEANMLTLEEIDFDLVELVEDLADAFAHKTQEKGLELVCTINDDVPRLLVGDPGRIRQILTNLLGNAVKFTQQGEIVLSANLQADEQHTSYIQFSVKDTGIGIDAKQSKMLFEQFTQADTSTTRQYGGTGLGLAIAKELTERMNGSIGVESRKGEGSEFRFTIQVKKQKTGQRHRENLPDILRGLCVLIVDDNATNREILSSILRSWGIRVREADGACSGIEQLRRAVAQQRAFDIAIIDMQMPHIDGLQLGETIHHDPDIGDTDMIMLTSLSMYDNKALLEKAGFQECLTKPARREDLKQALLRTVSRRKQAEEEVQGAQEKHDDGERRHKHLRTANVLLVEDNKTNQIVAQCMLRKLQVQVDTAENGREAIAKLEGGNYDLVLMDIQMPEMDGLEATKHIRDASSGVRDHHIPVIALTAHAMSGDRENCIDAGMDDYLTKPIQIEALSDILKKYL
ncbi:response regulator [Prosthecochloris sp. HL-130-GSB]|uniref:response regulator n=1 Tax=Prosthecochloris sp. HL-130-GSB TaxID=1974213 RepID=UPI000A1C10B9|nr:response regulator [Prosthecochloris sp. HL-130-GSB]ARM31776.1 hypothetical protein B9H02_11340 [Prosthecochloris sp. HL-130-GSB]